MGFYPHVIGPPGPDFRIPHGSFCRGGGSLGLQACCSRGVATRGTESSFSARITPQGPTGTGLPPPPATWTLATAGPPSVTVQAIPGASHSAESAR